MARPCLLGALSVGDIDDVGLVGEGNTHALTRSLNVARPVFLCVFLYVHRNVHVLNLVFLGTHVLICMHACMYECMNLCTL